MGLTRGLTVVLTLMLFGCTSSEVVITQTPTSPIKVETEGSSYRSTSLAFQTERASRLGTAAVLTATAELTSEVQTRTAPTATASKTPTATATPIIVFPEFTPSSRSLARFDAKNITSILGLFFPADVVAYTAGEKEISGSRIFLSAAGYRDGSVVIWDSTHPSPYLVLQVSENQIKSLKFDPRGNYLAVLDQSHQATIYETVGWTRAQSIKLDIDGPILFSPDGSSIVSLDSDQENIVSYKLSTQELRTLTRNPNTYSYAYTLPYGPYEFWSDGTLVTFGRFWEDKISLYLVSEDINIFFPYDYLDGDFSFPDAFSSSVDGRLFSIGISSGDIFIWDVPSKNMLSTLTGHIYQEADGWLGAIRKLEFSQDASMLLSVGWDRTTRLWDVITSREIRTIDSCCFAEFSESGNVFFTLDQESGWMNVWGVNPPN